MMGTLEEERMEISLNNCRRAATTPELIVQIEIARLLMRIANALESRS